MSSEYDILRYSLYIEQHSEMISLRLHVARVSYKYCTIQKIINFLKALSVFKCFNPIIRFLYVIFVDDNIILQCPN